MAARVESFIYELLVNVFNAQDTAAIALDAILSSQSFDPGIKAERLEDPAEWTEAKIGERAQALDVNKGPSGDFDD